MKNYLAVGSLGVSILIHLALFITISGVILIQAVVPKVPFIAGDPASASVAPLPEAPPEPMDDTPAPPAQDPVTDSEATAMPSMELDRQIVSQAVSSPVFNLTPSVNFAQSAGGDVPGQSTAAGDNAPAAAPKPGAFSPFGSSTPFNDAMHGSIYDLRKNVDGKPVKSDKPNAVPFLIEAFTNLHKNKGNRAYLDKKYYKGPTTLYASAVYMPPMSANIATTAFKSEKLVGCPGWLAYYEGWMTPPATGEYRFVGFADDNMLVFVNHKMVLHAFWPGQVLGKMIPTGGGWLPRDAAETDGRSAFKDLPPKLTNNGKNGSQYARYYGNWIPMEKGTAYKIVVVISEAYGGVFSAMLAIEQRGVTYPAGTSPAQQTRLPIFKLSRAGTPDDATMRRWPSDYDPAGPIFGLSANGVAQPKDE
ncbi:MAG: hypothetical protein LBK60_09410 [Verrucomicrobiales bacterium]|jgi:hypothetical protein|nr:hypothetical protein [Verrucomicrobiales bacterium]